MNPLAVLTLIGVALLCVERIHYWLVLSRWAYKARKRYYDPRTDQKTRDAIEMVFRAQGERL